MRRYVAGMLVLLILLGVGMGRRCPGDVLVMAKTQPTVVKVNVGNRVSLGANGEAAYESSDSQIASVNERGMVTGKQKGTVEITRNVRGKKKKYTVMVAENPKKPTNLPVSLDEVTLDEPRIQVDAQGNAEYSVWIWNDSEDGKIREVTYRFEIREKMAGRGDAATGGAVATGVSATGGASMEKPPMEKENVEWKTKTVEITAKNIEAGEQSDRLRCEGDYSGLVSQMKLKEIDLYTGQARYRYIAEGNKYLFSWNERDEEAPKIRGLVKGKSHTGQGDPYRTVYADMADSWDPTQFVSAVDNRDGKVGIEWDDSKINWKKSGVYKVYFEARDSVGNVAKSWAAVRVIVPGTAESYADKVLRSITRAGWSDTKKARAIYRYVRGHCSYVHSAPHQDWRTTAMRGMRYQSGDCYTYYSMSRLLLTRAGIPNVMIKRYPVYRGMRHYWNLAYVEGGWYHFDTTPRARGRYSRAGEATFCLWTDAQMFAYSRGYTFQFQRDAYVKRAEKRL